MEIVTTLKTALNRHPKAKHFLTKIYHCVKILTTHPSRLSLMKKAWSDRAPFIAKTVGESPLMPSSLLDGRCFFIPSLFTDAGLQRLLSLFKAKNYKKVAVIGRCDQKRKLVECLQNAFPSLIVEQISHLYDNTRSFDPSSYQAAVLAPWDIDGIPLTRTLLYTMQFSGDLFLESLSYHERPTQSIESTKPIVVCAYPCAGTNRFIFGFEYLMNRLKWKSASFSPFVRNVRYIHSMKKAKQEKADDAMVDQAFFWKIQTLDSFEWLNTHEYFSLNGLQSLDCRFVILMRDPRDIINSFYWHTVEEVADKQNYIHRLIDGYCRKDIEPNYAFNWPSANKILDIYLFALDFEQAHIIRFEELHRDDVGAFRKLMLALNLYPHPLIGINDSDFKHAAYLGSFEYQTRGRLKRGQDNRARVGGEYSGVSCRKGVVGDWRSSFTQKAIDHFKEATDDKLIRLGYEKDMNW